MTPVKRLTGTFIFNGYLIIFSNNFLWWPQFAFWVRKERLKYNSARTGGNLTRDRTTATGAAAFGEVNIVWRLSRLEENRSKLGKVGNALYLYPIIIDYNLNCCLLRSLTKSFEQGNIIWRLWWAWRKSKKIIGNALYEGGKGGRGHNSRKIK